MALIYKLWNSPVTIHNTINTIISEFTCSDKLFLTEECFLFNALLFILFYYIDREHKVKYLFRINI